MSSEVALLTVDNLLMIGGSHSTNATMPTHTAVPPTDVGDRPSTRPRFSGRYKPAAHPDEQWMITMLYARLVCRQNDAMAPATAPREVAVDDGPAETNRAKHASMHTVGLYGSTSRLP